MASYPTELVKSTQLELKNSIVKIEPLKILLDTSNDKNFYSELFSCEYFQH